MLAAGCRVAFIGDSLMQANHAAVTGFIVANNHGEVVWARAISGARFRSDVWYSAIPTIGDRDIDGANCGVSGAHVDSAAQTKDLEEQVAVALAYKPALVIIAGGTNDLSALDTAANLIVALTTIVDQFLSRGIRVILSTIRPRSTAGAGWEQGNGKWTQLANLNTAIRALCSGTRKWLYLWDAYYLLRDSGAAQEGEVNTAYVYDTLHLNAAGAQVSGALLGTIINGVIEPGTFFNRNAVNLVPNPAMTGTAGTKSDGVSGNVATGWNVNHDGAVTGNVTAVCAKINNDTVQEIVFTSDGGGATVEGFPISMVPTSVTVPDDQAWYQWFVPVEFDASVLWRQQYLYVEALPSGSVQTGHRSLDEATPLIAAWSGWFVTEAIQIPSGTTSIRGLMRIVLDEAQAGTATMRILPGAMLCQVSDPRVV